MKTRAILAAVCFLLLATVGLAACGEGKKSEEQTASVLEWQDLAGRSYVLVKINNQDIAESAKAPAIEFRENFSIAGKICNRFTGKAALENNTLRAPNMAATKMLCEEALNALETDILRVLSEDGFKATLADGSLTLSSAALTLKFIAQ